MILGHDSVIVQTMVRLLVPWIRIYALYVLFHGHYSPGGGFQAGVIMAASYVLLGLALGRAEFDRSLPELTPLGRRGRCCSPPRSSGPVAAGRLSTTPSRSPGSPRPGSTTWRSS
jgi:multisubunit Na+/H+ antiporter MnhB subunit